MKIINSHVHLIELDKVLESGAKYLEYLKNIPSFRKIEETIALISPEVILSQMEEAGISQSILFACEAPILYASNEFVAKVCQQFKDKFIGFASVNPKKEEAVKVLEDGIRNLGLKGLKLHPPLQDFYPNDKIAWPVYEKATQLNIPVVFHVGTTPFGSLVKLSQANPILIDEVAIAFPELKIILAHMGTLWHNETFMVAEKNPNVFIDTAAYPHEIKNLLTENLIKRVGEDKFIFGTDFPMPYEGQIHRMKDYVDCINGLSLSQEIKEKIFHENLEKLLKL